MVAVVLVMTAFFMLAGCGAKPDLEMESQVETQGPELSLPTVSLDGAAADSEETSQGEAENAEFSPEPETSEMLPLETVTPPETSTQPPADASQEPQMPVETIPEEPTEPAFDVMAVRAGLYNAKTLECLYAKAENEPLYPASLTKIVTACTALRYMDTDEIIRVGTELQFVKEGSSVCWIRKGHRLTLYDLLMGMLLPSGNDAAYTVAVNVARRASGNEDLSDQEAVEYFCELMNKFAWDVGARNSHFVNPDGWDDEEQYTTVSDLALIASCAIKYPVIREIVGQHSKFVRFVSGETITWTNSNYLLNPTSKYYYPDAFGMKTGSTSLAGKCLIAAVEIDGQEYISIVSGCETEKERYQSTLDLFGLVSLNSEKAAS